MLHEVVALARLAEEADRRAFVLEKLGFQLNNEISHFLRRTARTIREAICDHLK